MKTSPRTFGVKARGCRRRTPGATAARGGVEAIATAWPRKVADVAAPRGAAAGRQTERAASAEIARGASVRRVTTKRRESTTFASARPTIR